MDKMLAYIYIMVARIVWAFSIYHVRILLRAIECSHAEPDIISVL